MEEKTGYCVEVRRRSDGLLSWKETCENIRIVVGSDGVVMKLTWNAGDVEGDSVEYVVGNMPDGPLATCDREGCPNEAIEASPCDTGECDCYMGPIYSVSVGGLEFEETRSPDPVEAWRLFLPILERNPRFAEKGVRMVEVEEWVEDPVG